MKFLIFAATALLAVSCARAADSCYNDVSLNCAQSASSLALPKCNAVYADYGHHGNVATELQAYANSHLELSFQYLLSAAYFNNYQTNRAGFTKLFKKLSDEAWNKNIDLIKHITLRGDTMDFSRRSAKENGYNREYTVEVNELEALAKALDTQKELAERAFYIHREATRNSPKLHDPEITQYLEEEFIEDQAKTIRNLAGHTTDLKSFIVEGKDLSLALYMYDEYLQKIL